MQRTTTHTKTLAQALLLTALLASCGGAADAKEAGYESYNSGDHKTAVEQFDKALSERDASAPDYLELAIARCQAMAWVDDGVEAKAAFLELSASQELTPKDYSLVVSDLRSAKQWDPAIDLLEAGIVKFPDDPTMGVLKDKVVEAVKNAANPDALAKLKGLGYL